jgi:hypothetical protein
VYRQPPGLQFSRRRRSRASPRRSERPCGPEAFAKMAKQRSGASPPYPPLDALAGDIGKPCSYRRRRAPCCTVQLREPGASEPRAVSTRLPAPGVRCVDGCRNHRRPSIVEGGSFWTCQIT